MILFSFNVLSQSSYADRLHDRLESFPHAAFTASPVLTQWPASSDERANHAIRAGRSVIGG